MKHLLLNHYHNALVADFNKTLKVLGYNRSVDSKYPILVREFLSFLENRKVLNVCCCKASDVEAFHLYLSKRPNERKKGIISISHHRHIMFSIRLLFDYLLEIGEIENSPAYIPAFQWGQMKEREILSQREIEKIFSVCKTQLERAVIAIAYGCGLRRTEISNLKTSDILLSLYQVNVRDGKNHKNRSVPVTPRIAEILFGFIKQERDQIVSASGTTSQAFFLSVKGRPLPKNKFNTIFKRLLIRTGDPGLQNRKVSLHSLRHSIAVHMLNRNAEIDFVRRFLGHANIDTTNLYSKRRRQKMNMQRRILFGTRNVNTLNYVS